MHHPLTDSIHVAKLKLQHYALRDVPPTIDSKVEPKLKSKVEPRVEPKVEPRVEPRVEPKVDSVVAAAAIKALQLQLNAVLTHKPTLTSIGTQVEQHQIQDQNIPYEHLLFQKDMRINELNSKLISIQELETKFKLLREGEKRLKLTKQQLEMTQRILIEKEQEIQDAKRQNSRNAQLIGHLQMSLQKERKSNIAHIHLYQQTIQNISEGKQNKQSKQHKEQTRAIRQLKQKNEQLYKLVQKKNAVIAKQLLSMKQCKEKYSRLKQFTQQLVCEVKDDKRVGLRGYGGLHLESRRRSRVGSSRSSGGRSCSSHSAPRIRTEGLRFQDLVSSATRSRADSAAKCNNSKRISSLEKQVTHLKKMHRNIVLVAANAEITSDKKQQMDAIIEEYNDKKKQLEELKIIRVGEEQGKL